MQVTATIPKKKTIKQNEKSNYQQPIQSRRQHDNEKYKNTIIQNTARQSYSPRYEKYSYFILFFQSHVTCYRFLAPGKKY